MGARFSVGLMKVSSGYQAVPAISSESLTRAGLQLMAVPAPVGTSAPKLPDKGWAKTLGLKADQKIDDATIKKVLDYLEKEVRKQGDPTPGIFNPIYEQTIRDWRAATQKDLTEQWSGKLLGALPASPLSWGPNVAQGDIFKPGTVLGDSPVGGVIRDIKGTFAWVTNPDHIMGILAIVIGSGLILLSYPRILGDG